MRRDNMPKPDLGYELQQLPDWSRFVFLANFILFLPVFVLVGTTFTDVYLCTLTHFRSTTPSKRSSPFSPLSKMRSLPLTNLSPLSLSPTMICPSLLLLPLFPSLARAVPLLRLSELPGAYSDLLVVSAPSSVVCPASSPRLSSRHSSTALLIPSFLIPLFCPT